MVRKMVGLAGVVLFSMLVLAVPARAEDCNPYNSDCPPPPDENVLADSTAVQPAPAAVAESSTPLAVTGTDIAVLGSAGVIIVGVGAVLFIAGRRRADANS